MIKKDNSATVIPIDSDKKFPLFTIKNSNKSFTDIVLSSGNAFIFERIIKEINNWEVLIKNNLLPMHKFIFYGNSGCGKTLMSEVLSAELKIPLVSVRFESLISSLLGGTIVNLKKVFEYAHNNPCILFFDEFDAIGRSRGIEQEHGEIKRSVNTLLCLLDEYTHIYCKSIIIAATNFEQSLDSALWRRFDEMIKFDLPTNDQISKLIELNIKPFYLDDTSVLRIIDIVKGNSYSEITRLIYNIKKNCVLNNHKEIIYSDIANGINSFLYRKNLLPKNKCIRTPV